MSSLLVTCDPFANSRALFQEFVKCPTILPSALSLLDHVHGSGLTSKMTGYLIHSHRYTSSKPTSRFWELQASIVTQLCLIRSLSIVVTFVHSDHDGHVVLNGFVAKLRTDGWLLSDTPISYSSFGDSIAGLFHLFIGIHSNTEAKCTPIVIRTPPTCASWCIGRFLWAPFNQPEHTILYSRNNPSFNKHAVNNSGLPPLCISDPTDGQRASSAVGVEVKYFVHLPASQDQQIDLPN